MLYDFSFKVLFTFFNCFYNVWILSFFWLTLSFNLLIYSIFELISCFSWASLAYKSLITFFVLFSSSTLFINAWVRLCIYDFIFYKSCLSLPLSISPNLPFSSTSAALISKTDLLRYRYYPFSYYFWASRFCIEAPVLW